MTPRAVDPATVREKLSLLEDLLAALDLIGPVPPARLQRDVLARLALERVLTQAVDLVVSICSHIASAGGQRVPTTYRAAISDAAATGLLTPDLAASLGLAVGLRNILVHEYARVALERVAAAAPIAERDLSAFVGQVARWLTDHT